VRSITDAEESKLREVIPYAWPKKPKRTATRTATRAPKAPKLLTQSIQ
jgi:hypothetical protein